jgi:hypothetical protein
MSPIPRRVLLLAVGLAAAHAFVSPASAVLPPDFGGRMPASKVAALFTAIEKSDYAILKAGNDPIFDAVTKQQFDAAAARIGARLKGPHEVCPLGVLKKDGQQVSLWKVRFRDGGDDVLVTLLERNDRVTGISLD